MIHVIFGRKLKNLVVEAFVRGLQTGYRLGIQESLAIEKGKGVILGIAPIEKQVAEILEKEGF